MKSFLKGFFRFLKIAGILSVSLAAFSFIALVVVYFLNAVGLPNIKKIEDYKPPLVSQVLAHDGTPIGEYWKERRLLVTIEEVPPLLIQAFLAAEDVRFFEHRGIDFRGMLRAFIANLRAGEIVQGGSTITQQITRSLLLSPEKSVARKIKEAILATRLERHLNKEQILYLYLNQIYFGNRAYGVKAAAQNYFHKELDQLNLAEMSLIAGLPKAPTLHSPINNPKRARDRQLYVLSRMLEEGAIQREQLDLAVATPMRIYIAGTDRENNLAYAPHFMEHLRQLLRKKYGDDILYYNGLKIHTTLDAKLQKGAMRAIEQGLTAVDKRQGYRGVLEHTDPNEIKNKKIDLESEVLASIEKDNGFDFPKESLPVSFLFESDKRYKAIVLDFEGTNTKIAIGNQEGIIPLKGLSWARPFDTDKPGYEEIAYVRNPQALLAKGDVIWVETFGGPNLFKLSQEPILEGALFSMEPHTGLVRAVVGGYDFTKSEFNRTTQAARQPGSAFKPFIYTAALDKGYTFDTIINDSPMVLEVSSTEYWEPENYGKKYLGSTSFHDCLIHSQNVPTIKIGQDIGVHYITAFARKMGFRSPIYPVPSMALGSNTTTLEELTSSYSVFPNLGIYRSPIYVTKIEDAKGNLLEEKPLDLLLADEEKPNEEQNLDLEIKTLAQDELNTPLFLEQEKFIDKQDLLNLTPAEFKILYGANIPEGHVITPKTAYLMSLLLQDVVQQGTGWRIRALKRPVAGKTGTTNDETDAWFIGFTPSLLAGVWVGFDDPAKNIGKNEAGGRTAVPIFLDYMTAATEGKEVENFPILEGFENVDKETLWKTPGGSALFAERPPIPEPLGQATLDRSIEFFEEDFGNLEKEREIKRGEAETPEPEITEPQFESF